MPRGVLVFDARAVIPRRVATASASVRGTFRGEGSASRACTRARTGVPSVSASAPHRADSEPLSAAGSRFHRVARRHRRTAPATRL